MAAVLTLQKRRAFAKGAQNKAFTKGAQDKPCDHPLGFLAWPSSAMSSSHLDRRQRFFREPRLVWGSRVKLLSQRNNLAVDHHHPLRNRI